MKIKLPSDISQLLGGYSTDRFLARYWHKKPLLIRRAICGFEPVVSKAELFALAGHDEVESRRVTRNRKQWSLENGPFSAAALRRGGPHPWSLLVQGVNLHHTGADALLKRFNFIPAARLDDLMVSWASDGGGVGPHFDSYDVFLLQAAGRRRWRISMQRDRELLAGAPLKILRNFEADQEWTLEPGDMLYLPPGCAHDGVADGECMTYSIGFRAPSAAELTRGLLEHMADTIDRTGMYADPDLKPARAAAEIPGQYIDRALKLVGKVQPTRATVADFLGRYLSEPKPNVFFDPPERPATRAAFMRGLQKQGVRLDAKTRMLHQGGKLYINGEPVMLNPASAALRRLADARGMAPVSTLGEAASDLLYAWYEDGWLHMGEES
jgi:50S ribosomal protein L16 3-hydroxylase